MINQELINYIKQQIERGISKEEIRKLLLDNGWQNSQIDEAFNLLEPKESNILNQKRPKKLGKIIFITIALIIFLIIIIISLPYFLSIFFGKDIEPINDSQLSLKTINIDNNDNAYFDLIKIKEVIYVPDIKPQIIADMISLKTWDNKIAEDIILNNTEAFNYFYEASKKPKFQDPELAQPEKISIQRNMPPLNSWIQITNFSSIKAIYLAKQGKSKEAINEALNVLNIGQKIQDSQGDIINYIIGSRIKRTGLETIQKILAISQLKTEDLKEYTQTLNQYYKNENGLINALKIDYYLFSKEIKSIANGDKETFKLITGQELNINEKDLEKIKNNYYFKPNKTTLLLAENIKEFIKNTDKLCLQNINKENKNQIPNNFIKFYFEENIVGKHIYNSILADIDIESLYKAKCEEDLLISATQLMLAIKAFKNETNNYPQSLTDLIPNYLQEIPKDPFDGNNLRYSLDKKIIYSIGKDKKDLGGSSYNNEKKWYEMEDPTFIINF